MKNKGFSLIEVLVAMTILAIGLLAVATMQITSIEQNTKSYSQTGAATLGQKIIEDLLLLKYNSDLLKDEDGDGISGLNDGTSSSADYEKVQKIAGRTYQIFWNISENDPVKETKTICIIIKLQEKGQTSNIAMTQIRGS